MVSLIRNFICLFSEYEKGFLTAYIHGEGHISIENEPGYEYPRIWIYNTDRSVLLYMEPFLNRELRSLCPEPIKINEKKGERKNRKKLYYISLNGPRAKALIEALPELSKFDKTRDVVQKILDHESWADEQNRKIADI